MRDGAVETLAGIAVPVDLSSLATDADADSLGFVVMAAEHGRVRLLDEGRSALFVPDDGFVGVAQFKFLADDGSLASAVATVTITVSAANFQNLRLASRML